jgi:penicillin-binding protein 1A
MVTVRIDPKTGKLASPNNPDAIFEIFRVENVPQETEEQPYIASPTQTDEVKEGEEAPVEPVNNGTTATEQLF